MSWRGLVVAVLLAALGVAAGLGLGRLLAEEPASGEETVPVAAVSPSYPFDPPVRVRADPTDPPLERDLPTHPERIGTEPFTLRIPVPNGWARTNSNFGEWKWFVAGQPDNTYFLRVKLVGNQNATIAGALANRIDAVDIASATEEFDLESQTDDTFTASYVADGHRRLAMERFISVDGSETAYATIAVIGRMTDREGLADLLERVTDGATR